MALYSPMLFKYSKRAKALVNSHVVLVTSIVGKLKLARARRLPIAVIDNIGEMHGLTPPSRSDSAKLKQIRSS